MNFINSIRIVPDKALYIQTLIDQKGLTLDNILHLTKNLNEGEKQKLKKLYQNQIYDLNSSTENYKELILRIKTDLMA